jgi:WD40 repeat protein
MSIATLPSKCSMCKFPRFSFYIHFYSAFPQQGENLAYGCGRIVFIRGVKDPLKVTLFSEHAKDVTVAKISPSGFYCASGDVGGTVKIWSIDNPEHPVKYEGPMLAGSVLDLQWSPDSQLVVVVGEGRECFGKVFAWDTGLSFRSLSFVANRF